MENYTLTALHLDYSCPCVRDRMLVEVNLSLLSEWRSMFDAIETETVSSRECCVHNRLYTGAMENYVYRHLEQINLNVSLYNIVWGGRANVCQWPHHSYTLPASWLRKQTDDVHPLTIDVMHIHTQEILWKLLQQIIIVLYLLVCRIFIPSENSFQSWKPCTISVLT